MTKTSFGKYFDDQRDRIVKDMQNNKNTELYNAWREDFDKRQMDKKEKMENLKTRIALIIAFSLIIIGIII